MSANEPDFKLVVNPTIRARSPRELLIFSLDDTLVDTSLYWLARAAFARAAGAKAETTEGNIVRIEEGLETENNRTYEIIGEHATVTMQETWQAFQKECDVPEEGNTELYLLMSRVLRLKYPSTIAGAEDLLTWAQPRFTLALLSSGEARAQRQKLEAARLGGYFKEIRIVQSKGAKEYLALMTEFGFSPRNTWVIGGATDINPGIEAGANCILYTTPHPKRKGGPARSEELQAFRIHDLMDARAILAKTSTFLAAG